MAREDVKLKEARGGQLVQMWVETLDYGQLTEGETEEVLALWCNEDGEVSITFPESETPATRAYVAGDMVTFMSPVSVSITSGTFSFMVQ